MRPSLMIYCLALLLSRTVYGEGDSHLLESYPDHLQERLNNAVRLIDKSESELGRDRIEGIVETGRVWRPGTTVTVAFLDGSDDLVARVAKVAEQWTKHCNLTLSFQDESTGKYRRWSESDKDFSADIRVSFNQRGYWSLIGTDARDPLIARPNEPSLNLEQFDKLMPPHWESIVLHEFGHAIGFMHEHQHPGTSCDFRWKDDENYLPTRNPSGEFVPDAMGKRPGVYTVLSGPPNNWSTAKIEFNLKALTKGSSIYLMQEFDPKSIMLYSLPAWMFKGGERSHCHHSLNTTLSNQDREVALMAYPRDEGLIKKRIEAIEEYEKLKKGRE